LEKIVLLEAPFFNLEIDLKSFYITISTSQKKKYIIKALLAPPFDMHRCLFYFAQVEDGITVVLICVN